MRYILQTLAGYILALMVACLCLGVTGSCAAVQKGETIGRDIAVDCGPAALKAAAADLLSAVFAILTGSAVNWSAQLDALKSAFGPAVICAVAVAEHDLAPTSAPTTRPNPAALRAQSYLDARHLVITP